MAKLKKIGMAAGTFSVALGVGFVMQNGDALASRFGGDATSDERAPFTQTEKADPVSSVDLPEPPLVGPKTPEQTVVALSEPPVFVEPQLPSDTVRLPESVKVPEQQIAPTQLATVETDVLPEIAPEDTFADEIDCVPTMSLTVGAAATVLLDVAAPCHTSTPFTIHHQGMMFTAMTNEAGTVQVNVPALAEVAVMIAAFDGGDGAVGTSVVPDFANYDRAVLQWKGDAAMILSAYEGDADFGSEGHIFSDNPGDTARLMSGQGGYIVNLGDPSAQNAALAQVYTFPVGRLGEAFDVTLVAEAEITTGNCGQAVSAQSIQVSRSGQTSALDLSMQMPACDFVGDILILQNMFEDLTLASR